MDNSAVTVVSTLPASLAADDAAIVDMSTTGEALEAVAQQDASSATVSAEEEQPNTGEERVVVTASKPETGLGPVPVPRTAKRKHTTALLVALSSIAIAGAVVAVLSFRVRDRKALPSVRSTVPSMHQEIPEPPALGLKEVEATPEQEKPAAAPSDASNEPSVVSPPRPSVSQTVPSQRVKKPVLKKPVKKPDETAKKWDPDALFPK